MELFKWQNRTKFRAKYIKPLIDAGWLAMTIPDKPQSSKQRYLTTEAGKIALKEVQ
jgi:ATP-dependent DNA helicase RecG